MSQEFLDFIEDILDAMDKAVILLKYRKVVSMQIRLCDYVSRLLKLELFPG